VLGVGCWVLGVFSLALSCLHVRYVANLPHVEAHKNNLLDKVLQPTSY